MIDYLPLPLGDADLGHCECRVLVWEYESGLVVNVHDLLRHRCTGLTVSDAARQDALDSEPVPERGRGAVQLP